MTVTGTLYWDTTIQDCEGWLVHSNAVLDGAPCIPSPEFYYTKADADLGELTALIETTLRWEGLEGEVFQLVEHGSTYQWTANIL